MHWRWVQTPTAVTHTYIFIVHHRQLGFTYGKSGMLWKLMSCWKMYLCSALKDDF